MDKATFYRLIEHPEVIGEIETAGLKNILRSKPFFHLARTLYLKGLQNQNSYLYNQQLKETAAHAPDRGVLFDFIVEDYGSSTHVKLKQAEGMRSLEEYLSEEPGVEKELEAGLNESEEIEVKAIQDESAAEKKKEVMQEEVPFELIQEELEHTEEQIVEETSPVEEMVPLAKKKAEDDIFGKPLNFTRDEIHSFSEWLTLVSIKPIEREEIKKTPIHQEISSTTIPKKKETELVESFLEKEPKIQPIKKDVVEKKNLAEQSLVEDSSLMTETLAQVYALQGLHKKAIQAYKILLLKYPEKSSYFADRIREIEELKKEK